MMAASGPPSCAMTYRTILVHLDHSDRSPRRARLAAQWARTHEAHLVGLVPTGLVDGVIPADAIPSGASDYIAESASYLLHRAEGIRKDFDAAIAAAGPLSHEVRLVDSDTGDALGRHGRTSDLVVVGQDDGAGAHDTIAHALPDVALLHTGRPVLVVPSSGEYDDLPRRALLAWDGSREAAVAIRASLPALRHCTEVWLVSHHPPEAGRDAEAVPRYLLLDEMQGFLERHGICAQTRHATTTLAVEDALLGQAADLGAGLLVLGGYGHSRLRERLVGGVTRQILRQTTVPVLIAH